MRLVGWTVEIISSRPEDDDAIEDDLLEEQALLRWAAERHGRCEQAREQRGPGCSLARLGPVEPCFVIVFGVIEPVVQRPRDAPKIAPAHDFGEPNHDLAERAEFIVAHRARLPDRSGADQTP